MAEHLRQTYSSLVVHMCPAQSHTCQPESRAWRPGPQEEGQSAERMAGQFCCELIAQGGLFPPLDHPGAQQEWLYLVRKVSHLAHHSPHRVANGPAWV